MQCRQVFSLVLRKRADVFGSIKRDFALMIEGISWCKTKIPGIARMHFEALKNHHARIRQIMSAVLMRPNRLHWAFYVKKPQANGLDSAQKGGFS